MRLLEILAWAGALYLVTALGLVWWLLTRPDDRAPHGRTYQREDDPS